MVSPPYHYLPHSILTVCILVIARFLVKDTVLLTPTQHHSHPHLVAPKITEITTSITVTVITASTVMTADIISQLRFYLKCNVMQSIWEEAVVLTDNFWYLNIIFVMDC